MPLSSPLSSRWGLLVWLGAASLMLLAVSLLLWRYRDRLPESIQVPLRAQWWGVQIDDGVRIRADDGTELMATLFRPRQAAATLPTIFVRMPYDRQASADGLGYALFFARHGYAVLVQDVRGTFGSQGDDFVPWRHATGDGVTSVNWIVEQPWSNGKVGTFGCSALGELQFALARANHPAHAAMIASGAGGGIGSAGDRHGYFGLFEGGVFQLASGFGWFVEHGAKTRPAPPMAAFDRATALRTLPLRDVIKRVQPGANAFDDFVSMPLSDPRWDALDYVLRTDRLQTPALIINTWGDQTLADSLALAHLVEATDEATPLRVILAPGDHCRHEEMGDDTRWGDLMVRHAERPYSDWYLRWFDYWLRGQGNGLNALPAFQFFVVGENRWLGSQRWPPVAARAQRWYLASAGGANSGSGDGVLQQQPSATSAVDSYRYDPEDPVPTRGGPVCCTGDAAIRSGPVDQRDVEQRDDVLVYTSEPLTAPLRLVGPLRAHLVVSSSARDTDFVARLVDVWPDGRAINIQEGALRARYRNGIAKPQLLTPDEATTLVIEMRDIAWRLAKGHRLRLDISSSNFPRLERNLNTGGSNFDESKGVIAINRVFHGAEQYSYVEFSVLDDRNAINAPL
ncbi:MAG: hypothetical protein COW59_10155 [Lysobacterales bacterium CG17_big_fil_post_rev_8_21_14_2_50_64_11]|nr:MAG: hypothetical protein COW59_10155 [Xanthomonadales bacterium CG17_big_fil_post_rev_8_21_14_2_50_64_11]PIX60941.1 MAG: hypothetical protein COZ47_04590 [Xanthomonadales bacterium CG_4_10_14_3_um_filter_64_11]